MRLAFYKAFQSKGTALDKAIAVLTLGKHSHVELIFNNGKSFSISPREKKARFADIKYHPDYWEILHITITPEQELLIYNLAHTYHEYEYDYLGALFSATPFCIQQSNRIFCSEAITNLLAQLPQYQHLGDGCKYSPSKLYKSIANYSNFPL